MALTVGRGRSHDDTYFVDPHPMVIGKPSAPYLDTLSEPILKRVFTKEVLRHTFTTLGVT